MSGKIKTIKIMPGCVSCATCQVICPEIFTVDGICKVNQDMDFDEFEEKIKEAVEMCPVGVIKIVEKT